MLEYLLQNHGEWIMTTTKSAAVLAAVLLGSTAFAEEVRVYNWSDYIDEELLTKFEVHVRLRDE